MILVTGGTGMLGAHLLFQLINSGESVRAIYRSKKSRKKTRKIFEYYAEDADLAFSKIEWVKADVTDVPALETAFSDVEKVYHIAALVSFDEKNAMKMRLVNIEGTANIVNLCIAFGVKKLCHVSSIASVAKSVGKPLIDEKDEFNLLTNNYSYAITKYGAEMEVWRGTQEGLDVVVVNPGVILGPGFWSENSGMLFTMIYKGTPFYTEGLTGFVGVDDVVTVMLKTMDSVVKNERFILVSENISFKEVLFDIAGLLQKKRPRIKVTAFMAAIGWRLSWLKSTFAGGVNNFSKHTAKSANNKSYYNSRKVQKTFDFEFEKMTSVIAKIAKQFLRDIN
ncbi:NAD-dependent epimerase/dehydratase family protein [Flavicella sp.]|uniref:NAD-dependent epimerase/dehydratase family protein n=1 Tax=Flavicella sp. TaxID=2957742 RepID=UPI0030181289